MSSHDSPDGHEPYMDPNSLAQLHDEHMNEFLRSINMQGAVSEAIFSPPSGSTPSSHPIQIPLPDPPVIVPSQPLPVIENEPIYLQSAYPDPPSPQHRHEYDQLDYNPGPWHQQQQQQPPGVTQFTIPNAAHPDEHSWQTPQPQPPLRRPSAGYPSPYYQTTPSPASDLSPLPLTPGGVSRSTSSRANRAMHAAPYDPSVRRVSAPSVHRTAEDAMQPSHRTPSPARMPPPIVVPQRSEPMITRKRSRAGTGEGSSNSSRFKKAAASIQSQVAPNTSSSGSSQTRYPSQLQISPPSTTSPTIPSYASHSPVQSSPLVSAPVILPPQAQPLSPTTAPQQISPHHSPSAAPVGIIPSPGSSPAADSLLMSTHPSSSVAANSSSLSSSSGSTSTMPSSLSSSLSTSTSSSSIPRTIAIETRRAPQQVHVRPQEQPQRSQLRQPSVPTTQSRRGAPYPQSASARLAYQQATKSARATYLKHLTSLNFLGPQALLPSTSPQARQVQHPAHHPLAPWLTSDINTAEHIPADMRYDENSRILSAVLAVPGIEEEQIAVTLEDVHFNRNRVLYVSAFTEPTFPWPVDDRRMEQQSEVVGDIADALEDLENKKHMKHEPGVIKPLTSDGDRPLDGDTSSGSPSAQAGDAPVNISSTSKGPQSQSSTLNTPAGQSIRMGHMPNIRELLYGRQVRVINVPPTTQPKDVTVTLNRGLLYINVDMGEPLTTETATRDRIPIATPSVGESLPPLYYRGVV